MNIDRQYYIKRFMTTYFRKSPRIQPIANYLVYNTSTNEFSTKLSDDTTHHTEEHYVKILDDEQTFNIFVAKSTIDDQHFIESLSSSVAERRIYEYYLHYDLKRDDINISKHCQIKAIGNKLYHIMITYYASIPSDQNLDTFTIYTFSLIDTFQLSNYN